ncbi:hypothetical protein ALT_8120 [Aspergillus lentulus]|uniref:Uncharacterized protein n=1 Tax=Aspergillus lentulus TaxID=293939 RepID=A0AAN4PQX1_ASPLE|nr:hypothetical protein CNMCM6069_002487 [Aspergillus lentulus]KAF4162227.1 hypothetical protein CNMCM6936_002376 [Aspergillus lentulus]KAF4171361.1 hypothetical protein CNMCM8060_003073 [Aspergillus lentulus]KAF4178783.1 hypothetical protein CNMCM7927_002249 [Aspergillus lentulus]KAF4191713.1 hypothetical protein CNMCM8694_001440 [Aspergillus lentulus]
MSEFPSLQPAFTVQVTIDPGFAVGSASRSNSLQVVPMTGGTVKSDPGYSLALDAEFVGTGNDYIHADPDNKHLRLNAHGVIKTKDEALLYMNYTGVVTMGPAEQAVFSGKADDGATAFGNSFTHFTFETGDERYKEFENRVFVGQGRFRVEKGKPIVVEYKIPSWNVELLEVFRLHAASVNAVKAPPQPGDVRNHPLLRLQSQTSQDESTNAVASVEHTP